MCAYGARPKPTGLINCSLTTVQKGLQSAAAFWTQSRLQLLDPATRRECEEFYNVTYTPPLALSANGEDGNCVARDVSSVSLPIGNLTTRP